MTQRYLDSAAELPPPNAEILLTSVSRAAVWWMAQSDWSEQAIAHWRLQLDQCEQERADSLRFETDRATFIAAHWLLRRAVAKLGMLQEAEIRFVADPGGKPRLDPRLGRKDLHFGLTHTRGFVACAVTTGHAIGLDIEVCDTLVQALDIADGHFHPSEAAFLRRLPPCCRTEVFTRIWTLKEAFLKATGEGLLRPLDSFALSLDPVSIAFDQSATRRPGNMTFGEWKPAPRHRLALAAILAD